VKPHYVDCGNESSWERKFQRAKVLSSELSFPGAKVRRNESSIIQNKYCSFSVSRSLYKAPANFVFGS